MSGFYHHLDRDGVLPLKAAMMTIRALIEFRSGIAAKGLSVAGGLVQLM